MTDAPRTEPATPTDAAHDEAFTQLARDVADVAYLEGDFVLSSGARSNYYLDKYLFTTKPDILRRVSSMLARLVPDGVDRIAGPELGAVALAAGLSLETELPFVIVRKGGKDYGTNRLIEGELDAGETVLVVEDIISSGAQAIAAAQQLDRAGATVAGILGVIDRDMGGRANIEDAGFAYTSLFTRYDLGV